MKQSVKNNITSLELLKNQDDMFSRFIVWLSQKEKIKLQEEK